MYRIVRETGCALTSTSPSTLPWPVHQGFWRIKFKFETEGSAKGQNKAQTMKDQKTTARAVLWVRAAPRSFIDSLLRAVPGVVQEGLSVSLCWLSSPSTRNNCLFHTRGFAIEPVLYLDWILSKRALYFILSKETEIPSCQKRPKLHPQIEPSSIEKEMIKNQAEWVRERKSVKVREWDK